MTTVLVVPKVSSPASGGLRRELGLGSATAAVAGSAIAVGIFLTPAGMAKSLGSPFWLLIVWLAIGVMTLCGALCFGELAGRFPRAGGQYVYLHETFGPRIAFLFGWMCLLVLDPGLTAALSVGMAGYAAYIFHWSPFLIKLAALLSVWALCMLNILSIRVSAGFLRWITWLKLGTLAFITVWAILFRLGSWSNFQPFVTQHAGSESLAPALAGGAISAFFSFGGWWDVSKIAGEIREPGRTLPRAMLFGVAIVTVTYIAVSAVFVYLIPVNAVVSGETFVAQAGEVMFGHSGAVIFASIVVVCILGGLAAFIMFAPRVYYAMAKDGLFLPAVARIHARFGTPVVAIAIQGAIASVLIALGSFDKIIPYFMFAAVGYLGLTVAGLFVARSRHQEAGATILAPAYPWTPCAFLLMVLVLLVMILMRNPAQALLGLAMVATGLPVYEVLSRTTARGPHE
jgi:APA family basic amino acid/polyamine antiporter